MIRQRDLTASWVLAALSLVLLLAGALAFDVYSGTGGVVMFLLATLCLIGIFWMGGKKTCCPHCGGRLRFGEVQQRAKRGYYCIHCGKKIGISKD